MSTELKQEEVTDSMIREAFLANGFTIKDGHSDLKPYVYAAARATLALRPQAVPMTDGIRPEDFTVDVVVKLMGGFAPVNTQGVRVTHKPTGISVTCDVARSQHANRNQAFEKLSAILALRPERVQMTPASRDVIMATRTANADADEWPEPWAYQRGWNDAEAHHGITAQAKKETP